MHARNESGFSLIEVLVSSTLGVLLLLLLIGTVDSVERSQSQILAQDRGSSFGHRVLTELRSVSFTSRRLLQDDAEGRGYFDILDTEGIPPLLGSRLPMIAASGRLEPDQEGEALTGNAVLFLSEEVPQSVPTSGGTVYRVSRVRFVAFYLTRSNGQALPSLPDPIDVARFSSLVFADRASLFAIANEEDRREVVALLAATGTDLAWVSGAGPNDAFHRLLEDGSIAGAPVVSPTIGFDDLDPPRRLIGYHPLSVAVNGMNPEVPRFARVDPDLDGFPGGFEVKVVGQSGGRKVLVRLVLISASNKGWDVASDQMRIWTMRDL